MELDEMLDKVKTERAAWDELIALIPEERMDESLWDDGWNVKDVIAHVNFYVWWTAEFIRRRDWPVVDDRLQTADMDARNDALYLINKDRALKDILAESPKVHQQLVTALASLNTGQINDPTFLLDPPPPGDWSVRSLVESGTWQHFPVHAAQLEHLLASTGAG